MSFYLDVAVHYAELAWDGFHAYSPKFLVAGVDALADIMYAHPAHAAIEVVFLLVIVYFMFLQPRRKAGGGSNQRPTAKEQEEMLAEWSSHPFEPSSQAITNVREDAVTSYEVTRYHSIYADVKLKPTANPVKCLNWSSYDFLSYSTDERVVEKAKATVRAYGVGSCGPRGFYGSMKPHIDLEVDLAEFLGVHSAIIYSFQFATTSTLIPCFAAKQDTILCDNACNVVIQKGCTLARAQVTHFRHNDVEHLEELMKKTVESDRKHRRPLYRRFVVTEGIFRNAGDICPLPKLVELCEKYKFRIILDDSYGFGTIGATGRGTPEHFGIAQNRIDIYIGSLAGSLGAVGGFCAGTNMVVDHQRLGATGYVFSAALPPYVTVAASTAVKLIKEEPHRIQRLQKNAKKARSFFAGKGVLPYGVRLRSCYNDVSPLLHFITEEGFREGKMVQEDDDRFEKAVNLLANQHGILACRSLYNGEEKLDFPASLRLALRSEMTEAQTVQACEVIAKVLHTAFAGYQ